MIKVHMLILDLHMTHNKPGRVLNIIFSHEVIDDVMTYFFKLPPLKTILF
jgi:hypothetical protein